MYTLIRLTLLVTMVSVLTTIEPTTATGGRIWKCESEYSKYTDTECEKKTNNITAGCYHLDFFQRYKSCAAICNGVKEHSIGEQRCNNYCPDYLSHDGDCTLPHEVDTTTTAETSTNPATTNHTVATTTETSISPTTTNHPVATAAETSTNPTTTNHTVATTTETSISPTTTNHTVATAAETSTNPTTTNHTVDTTAETSTNPTTANYTVGTTTTDGSVISSSSSVVTGLVTGFVCLMIGVALSVGGTYFYFKRKGQPQEPPPAANAGAHVVNESGEPIRLTVLDNRANGVDDAKHDETTILNGHANNHGQSDSEQFSQFWKEINKKLSSNGNTNFCKHGSINRPQR